MACHAMCSSAGSVFFSALGLRCPGSGSTLPTMTNGTLKLTAAQLAQVHGRPGDVYYRGPNWAKIAAKQGRYAKLEAQIGQLMTERADMDDELADLIKQANVAIEEARGREGT
jgi:hypothetical protein